ncbi:uncharacterized protein TNCT_354051 [Trichonephila clavata]|uniref:Uncharacterized protein n=3 Tax=Nephilidae TaxID=450948 RepID=A0A8X6HYJ3_TRICU|nr:uncharacterized protein TNCT_354051 [Trichonephila clavata]
MGFKEDQMVTVSLYARVSSGKQAQENTIASQVAALERQISVDGYELLREYKFIDNGYSGSNLVRPNLEKLRDRVAEGKIDKIYIHSPDRLSRKYAYQMILLEEFQKAGAEAVFLNYEINDNPESQLLLQMQGMIAEYERAKIMERSRRGKIYAANKGCVSVMGGAPYGYRYIDKCTGVGQALFEINEEEADVVRKVFLWVGRERASIGEVCRRLNTMSIITRTGKKCWDRSVIWGMLKNPAYKGQAAFGKTKVGVKLQHIRPQRHSCEQPKDNYSIYPVEKANWIYVKVPNIVNEDVFDIVQEQLAENRKIARTRERGAKYLLQGLIVCKCCRYAYYGSPVRNKRGEKVDHYAYYRCIGRDSYRFGGNKICDNKHIRTDALETAVWEEVKHLLKNPNRILEEYKRKLSEFKRSSWDKKSDLLEKQENKLQRGIARLIDSYAQEYISQEEFEPRVKAMKQSLKAIEEEKKRIFDQKKLKQELTLVVTNLEDFSSNITSNLDNADWITKRDIIRTLVKRIEINLENVNVVFRVKELPDSSGHNGEEKKNLQHCWGTDYNNHVPVFTFEVQTAVKSNEFSVAKNIRNINIIPGSGEFVYDTKIQKKIAQEKISSNQYIPYGLAQRVNHNNHTKKSDAMLSLDQLKGDLPNVEWVSVVVNWFVNDLNIKDCKIYPAVEFQDDSAILPDDWQVGGVTRDNAQLISKDASGNPRYGGTVSDAALIRYIEELHSRGYKVMLYPMPLLDTKNKEWRGRLSGTPEDISDFFKNQYNKFIEHYASIAKQTKVEGFIIGSEFAQLTKIRDEQGNYPAVIELVKLAKRIKLQLGKEVTVTYAADWSEYHSYDGWYNMDELWSSEYIDVVGIDAYFPLTDGPEPPFGYSAEDVMGAGLMLAVGAALSIASGLSALLIVAASVVSALIAGGVTYTISKPIAEPKPTTELKEVDIGSAQRGVCKT